jgi:hypothetical protein
MLFLIVGQLALGLWLRYRHAAAPVTEYDAKLAALQRQRETEPGRPLIVVLGSSRPLSGVWPALLAGDARDQPRVFNFALISSGPVRELIVLRRLLAAGIRPDGVVIEIWPAFLPQSGWHAEARVLAETETRLPDWPVLGRYFHGYADAFAQLCTQTLTPAVHHRAEVLAAVAPFFLSREDAEVLRIQRAKAAGLDRWGWRKAAEVPPDPPTFAVWLELGRQTTESLLQDLSIHPTSDGALHELLDLCVTHGIRPLLLLMPEHSAQRGWYSAVGRVRLEAYLTGIGAEYRVPVVDARSWLGDGAFGDFCHLLLCGTVEFTRRFGDEVLGPWWHGRPLPEDVPLKRTSATTSVDAGRQVGP